MEASLWRWNLDKPTVQNMGHWWNPFLIKCNPALIKITVISCLIYNLCNYFSLWFHLKLRLEAGNVMRFAVTGHIEYTTEKYPFCWQDNLEGRWDEVGASAFWLTLKSHNSEQCCNGNGNLCRHNCMLPLYTGASFAFVETTNNCRAII